MVAGAARAAPAGCWNVPAEAIIRQAAGAASHRATRRAIDPVLHNGRRKASIVSQARAS